MVFFKKGSFCIKKSKITPRKKINDSDSVDLDNESFSAEDMEMISQCHSLGIFNQDRQNGKENSPRQNASLQSQESSNNVFVFINK